jgi:hypothetical protein
MPGSVMWAGYIIFPTATAESLIDINVLQKPRIFSCLDRIQPPSVIASIRSREAIVVFFHASPETERQTLCGRNARFESLPRFGGGPSRWFGEMDPMEKSGFL